MYTHLFALDHVLIVRFCAVHGGSQRCLKPRSCKPRKSRCEPESELSRILREGAYHAGHGPKIASSKIAVVSVVTCGILTVSEK